VVDTTGPGGPELCDGALWTQQPAAKRTPLLPGCSAAETRTCPGTRLDPPAPAIPLGQAAGISHHAAALMRTAVRRR
ncbi:hypothetical protein KNN17_21595, partial [Arthrobacter bambusae]|uniref:hypothetical protein n=1 Tax=Arthrobacter bambusae TaxID=1338426 RepID=UPI001F50C17E